MHGAKRTGTLCRSLSRLILSSTGATCPRWAKESRTTATTAASRGTRLAVAASASRSRTRKREDSVRKVRSHQGNPRERVKWDDEDSMATAGLSPDHPSLTTQPKVILDPTAGGGSIPFEAMRLGHHVIANELNPVATVILYATLDYPARFGPQLAEDIGQWGNRLVLMLNVKWLM